jgi:hypothetical protein
MNTLHLTSHIGTTKNIQNVFKFLNIENKLITKKCINNSYYYSEPIANKIWEYYSDKLNNINVIIFTDTSMIARPFLQNIDKHNCLLIVYITNRFDWGIWGFKDEEYYKLYSELSNNKRVIFCADNNYDQYYAMSYNIKFMYEDSIKLTPLITNNIKEHIIDKFFIYNRGTHIKNYKKYLKENEINYDLFGEGYDRYKDNEHICEYKGFIHLPYQTNIQSLWENLGYFIIYYIPSKNFITELINDPNSWYYWEEKNRPYDMLIKSIELSEWYNPDNQELFEYFDSWTDLKNKIQINNQTYIFEKKHKIKTFIENSNNINIQKWKNILNVLFNDYNYDIV